ncbi:hypothetical protein, partial [Sulfuriflexus sp.]|uniref:hypothetical protein n=1 Tax=Sulfuriflexus sp. TaxID=2015443 RepID=UPI0028CC7C31
MVSSPLYKRRRCAMMEVISTISKRKEKTISSTYGYFVTSASWRALRYLLDLYKHLHIAKKPFFRYCLPSDLDEVIRMNQDEMKKAAAEAAIEYVESG